MKIEIRSAYKQIEIVKELLLEYVESLGVDLRFQDFEREFQELPKRYEMPLGRLYVAYVDGVAAGCVGLCPFEENNCEIRRLYVRPEFRGEKVGQMLTKQVISDAHMIGYEGIYLDTLSTMDAAHELYSKLGFVEIQAYYYNPIPKIKYFCLKL